MDRNRRLCTICARGGSKGVVNKNIRSLLGEPLIVHTIRQARSSGVFDSLAVSSDSEEILEIAARAGVDHAILRPAELATDSAAKLPAIVHAVGEATRRCGHEFDVLVDLDATSPLRFPADIVTCVQLLEQRGAPNVITGTPSHRSPYFNLIERDARGKIQVSKALEGGMLTRRQDAPPCFDMNASIYVWNVTILKRDAKIFYDDTVLYEMPLERSWDIDSPLDFEIVEFLMARERRNREIGRL